MKKIALGFIVLFVVSQIIFAGSIPEDLLSEDNAKLYIGVVEEYQEEEIPSAPYVKVTTATIKPTKKIKGDLEIGKIISYSKTHIYLRLEKGKEYLIADVDENNVYAYAIKSKTDRKIELVDSDKYDMTARLEQYINEGKYEVAEKERLATGKQTNYVEEENQKPPLLSLIVVLILVISVLCAVIYKKIKR